MGTSSGTAETGHHRPGHDPHHPALFPECRRAVKQLVDMVSMTVEAPLAVAYAITADSRVALGCRGLPMPVGDELPLHGSLAADITATGLPLIIADVATRPEHADKEPIRRYDARAYAGFPVRDHHGTVISVLAAATHQPHRWTPQQLRTLDASAQLLGDLLGWADAAGAHTTGSRLQSRHSESMSEALLEAAPDAIIGVTADGTITFVNAHAEQLFGYRREELLGNPIELLVPPEFRQAHPRHRDRYIAHPKRRPMGAGVALSAVRKDGSQFPAETSLSALETGQGLIFSAAVRDVTDRVIAQAERERLIAQAERDAAERRAQHARRLESLGELAGGVAHDFNNILAVISNYSELIQDTLSAGTPDAAEVGEILDDLQQISRAAERATRLTKQLLAFGRRDITQMNVLDLNRVITDVQLMLRPTLGEHIQLVTHMEQTLWPVRADVTQIEQVLVNLAVNARDAMPGGGTLSIETTNAELDEDDVTDTSLLPGRYARIRLSDTGTGMTPDVIEHAFEPFYTTKPRGSGTGLGLATVYGIVKAAGGDVLLYSEAGIGTTITILLPITTEAPTGDHPPETAQPAAAPSQATILLVEDEDALRQVAGRILNRAGYTVLPAAGGHQAIHIAQTHPGAIDLLLTDVIMPKMFGNEVAEHVHRLRPQTPVLYMSGYAQPVLTENGTLPDGVIIVEKPFTSQELLDHVSAMLAARTT